MENYWITAGLGFVLGGFTIGFGAPSGMTIVGAALGLFTGYIYFEKYKELE